MVSKPQINLELLTCVPVPSNQASLPVESRNTGWTKLNNKYKTHTGFSHKVFWLFLEMLYFGYIGINKCYHCNSYHPFIFFPFIHVANRKSKIKYVAFLCSSYFFFFF